MKFLRENVSENAPKIKKNAALEKTKTNVVSIDEIKENPDEAPKPSS